VTTLLVANRGEIARRIFRTAKRLGMRTVAVYSDADASMPFVREADAALRLGPAPARESYLAIDRIMAAARESRAELVHPGYGFLAESPALANAVVAAGLRFVGPPAPVLAALGNKVEAKEIAERAHVPVLPGYRGIDQSDSAFATAARETGYPVMIKPAAGGGGIGMQTVRDERELRDALARARRLAMAAFNDERLLLERLVERARHVEVQILADEVHKGIAESALRVARAAGYVNAGTVEFLVDDHDRFSFLEVNARLQVEHPVTELVFGVDLVEQQLRIALGDAIAPSSRAHGVAIEARVYAEDPASGFVPSTGRLLHVHWPDGVRIDAGYEEGDVVTHHYDPLLAKIVAHGSDPRTALGKLSGALAATEILGVRTNLPFLRALLRRAESERLDTEFVERELAGLVPERQPAPDEGYALAAASAVSTARSTRDPWTSLGPWRIGLGYATTVVLREGERERAIRLEGAGPYRYGDRRIAESSEHHRWTIDGALPAAAAQSDGTVWIGLRGETWELGTTPRERSVEQTAGAQVAAPMPGVVIAVSTGADRRVRRGDLLFVVEAMKMELRVEAPADGTVTRVLARVGQQVKRGERLADFAADPI